MSGEPAAAASPDTGTREAQQILHAAARRRSQRGCDDLMGEILWLEETGDLAEWRADFARHVYRVARWLLAWVLR